MKQKTRIWYYSFVLLTLLFLLTTNCKKTDNNGTSTNDQNGTVTDVEGNIYWTVRIGKQVWMAENLKTTKYRNGDPIPNITSSTEWLALTTGAYCNYDNDSNNSTSYGKLYNWYAVNDSRYLTPVGWHVPTNAEWNTLVTFWGGDTIAGAKLKETGTTHWPSPNLGSTNETGFTAIPGGYRAYVGNFLFINQEGYWWSSSLNTPNLAWDLFMLPNFNGVANNDNRGLYLGLSVRCIKD
jgi:uncharacterized protein (TIGR02145 family)